MFQVKFKALLTISFIILMGSNISWAKTAKKETKKPTRQVASASYFSGARVGSSTVIEVGSLSVKDTLQDIARFESYSLVKKLSDASGGKVSLVQIDNGGSTDIGAAMAGSSLYLTFFQDGEMRDASAAFPLGEINSFKVKNVTKSSVTIELKCKNDRLNDIKVDTVVSFEAFEKKFLTYTDPNAKPEDEWETLYVPGKITTTKTCLPISE